MHEKMSSKGYNIRELGIDIDERVNYADITLKIQDKTELFYSTKTLIMELNMIISLIYYLG